MNLKKIPSVNDLLISKKFSKKNIRRELLKNIINKELDLVRKILKNVPELEIINVYDEYYDLSNPISLNSGSDYAVLLLRKN